MKSGNATVWRFQAKYRILPIKAAIENRHCCAVGQFVQRPRTCKFQSSLYLRLVMKKNDTCHSDVHDLCKFPLNLSLGNAKKGLEILRLGHPEGVQTTWWLPGPCTSGKANQKLPADIPSENPRVKQQKASTKIRPQARHKDEETAPHN